jgi:hypothetical protein
MQKFPKEGDRVPCNLCGREFVIQKNKVTAKYCDECKYKPERRWALIKKRKRI